MSFQQARSQLLGLLIGGLLIYGCTAGSTTPAPPASATAAPEVTFSPAASLPEESEPETGSNINCTEINPHPMGQSIADKFSVEYEDVMAWYCDGYAFEDILLALQTSQLADQPVDEILESLEDLSWDEIWENLGLVPE